MRKLKNSWRALLTATVIFTMLIVFTGCSLKHTPEEKYYNEKQKVTVVESDTLYLVKDVCKTALDSKKISVTDMFIKARIIDGISCINLYALTDDGQYRVFDVETKYNGIMVNFLINGKTSDDVMDYLYGVIPELEENTIFFDNN